MNLVGSQNPENGASSHPDWPCWQFAHPSFTPLRGLVNSDWKHKMDITQSKLKAKVLATYLREIGSPIKHGQALDAMARINGHRSWNAFSAAEHASAEAAPALPDVARPVALFVRRGGARERLAVSARMRTDDHRARAEFDAGAWLSQASDEVIEALVNIGFGGDYASDSAAEFMEPLDAGVARVFEYLDAAQELLGPRESLGFEADLEPGPVWAYLRAFRYAVYVRVCLREHFGSLTAVDARVLGALPPEAGADEQWAELGTRLEGGLAAELGIALEALDVERDSGELEGGTQQPEEQPTQKVAGRLDPETGCHLVLSDCKPLTHEELRRITSDGQYMLDIVLGVELEDIVQGIDSLNDHVSERITGSCCGLEGLSYWAYAGEDAVALAANYGAILRVRAQWRPSDDTDNETPAP